MDHWGVLIWSRRVAPGVGGAGWTIHQVFRSDGLSEATGSIRDLYERLWQDQVVTEWARGLRQSVIVSSPPVGSTGGKIICQGNRVCQKSNQWFQRRRQGAQELQWNV